MVGAQVSSKFCYSTVSFDSENDDEGKNIEIEDDYFLPEKPELQLQSVDPRKGWGFRGVHKVLVDVSCDCITKIWVLLICYNFI